MTRDPEITIRSSTLRQQGSAALNRISVQVGLVAALAVGLAAAAIDRIGLRDFAPWADLVLALVVAGTACCFAAWRWSAALPIGASSGWHRANGLLLLLPACFASAFFMIELVRIAWSLPQVLALAMPMLALVAGGGMRWLLTLAHAEAAIEGGWCSQASTARTVGFVVAGIVVLLLALELARNIEYLGRISASEPVARLVDQAASQRMLGQRVARLAARIEAEQASAPSLRVQLDEAIAQLDALGLVLAPAVGDWKQGGDASAAEAAIAELAIAGEARSSLLSAARDFRDQLVAGEPSRTEYLRLQAEADQSVAAFDHAVAALSRAAHGGRLDLRRTTGIGVVMLVLVALLGGTALTRATSRLVRAQQRVAGERAVELDRLAEVVRNTRAFVVVADTQGRTIWVNPAFEDLTGWSAAEMIGRTPGSVLQCPDTDPETVARVREALRARRAVRVDILNRKRDGQLYWVDLSIEPQHDETGRHVGFISFATDVTETVILRQRHRALFDTMAAGVVVVDAGGTIVDCNEAACRLLGFEEEQLRGRDWLDPRCGAVREDGAPFPVDQHYTLHTLRTGEAVNHGAMGVCLPDGSRRWLEISTRQVPGERPGERAVVASLLDVTSRREASEALSSERARLTAALDGTNAGVWHWRVDEDRVEVDARWAEIHGDSLPLGGVVTIEEWMDRLHPDDAPVAREAAQMHFLDLTEHYDAELRIRHRDGRWGWVHCRGRLTERDADGAPKSMFGTAVDITARKESAVAASSEQHKLRTLFDLAPVGVALARDEDGAIMDCNLALCALLDRSPSDLAGRNLRDLTPADGLREWESRNAEFRSAGSLGPYEKEYLRPDGTRVPVLVSARRVPMSDGTTAIWVIVQDMSERKEMERGLQIEARTDKLTGLANRAALMERLESAVQQARVEPRAGFGLLFLDFDRFKLVNDTLGHDAGDELLRQIAQRLRGALRLSEHGPGGGTFVARIGGDEFVVLVAGTSDVHAIERVTRRLLGALAAPYPIRGSEVQSSASIGVVSTAHCELDASALLRDADTAMYEAKRRGRGLAVVFDDSMRSRLQRQVEVERNLRRAIAQNELSVCFQPIVDLDTGVVASVEALLRWTSAELGVVSPAEFIPIAEDSGQIVEIGGWVLEVACRQFAAWRAQHPQSKALVSVNLSRVQLSKPDVLLATVERVLEESGLPADRLQLEVTERDVMRDPAAVLLLMRHLRALGVRLAMDDFGTGTSSLACLRDYPFDVIKIDRGFVGDLGSNGQVLALVHATMMLIENLGMTSVAEGVETTAQAAILQSVGCRLAQGWLFGQPMALSDLRARVGADG